ncbi:MAG TPA: hypothetical protein DEA96_05135 [Leptospiraceae bacterium]|nr:hypothetical protein [Spirochaetaceae bacterium]HBS04329.1 hypothetical protein [Leptospiraceae bacterium]|tara:strand:- start:10753 stop:11319 length:567 start_codon:yes stop_codon:yes gene_type:complete
MNRIIPVFVTLILLAQCAYLPVLNGGSETGEVSTPSETATRTALFLAEARLKGHSIAILGEESVDGVRRFSVLNISGKTISKATISFFALDESGNKIFNDKSAGKDALEENIVISELEGEIKSGAWGDVEIQESELPGWDSTRFRSYEVTFTDGKTARSQAPASEYVLGGVDAEEASRALRLYDERRK